MIGDRQAVETRRLAKRDYACRRSMGVFGIGSMNVKVKPQFQKVSPNGPLPAELAVFQQRPCGRVVGAA